MIFYETLQHNSYAVGFSASDERSPTECESKTMELLIPGQGTYFVIVFVYDILENVLSAPDCVKFQENYSVIEI